MEGDVLYRDKAAFAGPGIYYFLALLYKVFGISYLVSRYAMAVVFSTAAVLVFLTSRRLMTRWLALLTALVFVVHRVWAFPIWNMIGYATFSICIIALVLLLLMEFNKRPNPTMALLIGFSVAIATLFKQDYGGFTAIGVALYLILWPWLRAKNPNAPKPGFSQAKLVGAYILGGIILCVPVFAYFLLNDALDDFFRNTLIVPLTMESKAEYVPLIPLWPLFGQDAYFRAHLFEYLPATSFMLLLSSLFNSPHSNFLYDKTAVWDLATKLIHYSPYLALLGVAGILARRYVRRNFSAEFENAAAAFVVSASVFATQHRPFDFAHLMQMYLPIFLLLGWIVDRLRERIASRKVLHHAVFGGLGVILLVHVYYSILGVNYLVQTFSAKLEGPRAGIYMLEQNRNPCSETIRFIQQNTSPQEPIFVLGHHGLLYFLSERPNPTRFDMLWPTEPFPTTNEEIIDTLERKRVRYLIEVANIDPLVGTFRNFAPDIAEYVSHKYTVEKSFGRPRGGLRFIILTRKEDKI